MKKSKLVRVLKSLNNREQSAFSKFLVSPYFNQREDVVQLYEYLKQIILEELEIPTKEMTHQIVFSKLAYNPTNFDLLMSYLFQLLKQFLVVNERNQHQLRADLELTKIYRKKGLKKDFIALSNQLQKRLQSIPGRSADFYYLSYQLQWEQHQELSAQSPSDEVKLREMANTIDIHYLALKLKHACLVAAHQSVYQSDYEMGFLQEIFQYVASSGLIEIPAIGIYFHYYQILKKKEEGRAFQQFKQLLFHSGDQFHQNELRDLYLMAINYCVRSANEGEREFLDELFELYQEGLKSESLLEEGVLSRFTYHNITGAGLRTGRFEWTEEFIHHYKNSLEKRYRESSFSFSLARLEYSRKNYDQALQLLQKSNYRDLLLNLAAKTLQLKIYYELTELDLLLSHVEAMKKYILRRHLIGYHKTNYKNIINYARRLGTLNVYDKKSVQQFYVTLQNEEVLTEKEWFLQQVELLL